VLVVLGVSLVTLGSVQHTTTAQQLQSVRAYYAARAGVQWAAAQAGAGGCPAGPTAVALPGDLSGFTVSVRCSMSSHDLGTGTPQA
jgi:MSHA biogenesis protein MshP